MTLDSIVRLDGAAPEIIIQKHFINSPVFITHPINGRAMRYAHLPIIHLLLAIAAPSAHAQRVTFHGVAPGLSPDETRTGLRAAGFRYRGTDQIGDQVYAAPDSSELVVMFAGNRAAQFEQSWEGPPAFIRRRARVIDDSLNRIYGRKGARGPVTVSSVFDDEPSSRLRSPYVRLVVTDTALTAAEERRRIGEMDRLGQQRADSTERAAATPTAVGDTSGLGEIAFVGGQGRSPIELDVAGATRVRPGVYRTRLTAEYWWQTRLPNGMIYDRETWDGEMDCTRLAWRTLAVTRFSANQPLPAVPGDVALTSPLTAPGGETVARTSCTYLQTPRANDASLAIYGLAWGAPAAAVHAAAAARGFRFRGVDQLGAHVFSGPGEAELVATIDSNGLIRTELSWRGTPTQARARYTALVDSLRRALGPHRPADPPDVDVRVWSGRNTSLVAAYGTRPAPNASLTAESARYWREMQRMADIEIPERQRQISAGTFPRDTAVDRAWEFVAADGVHDLSVDSSSIVALGGGGYRVRIQEHWRDFRRLPNALIYEAEIRTTEIDCARGRWRAIDTLHVYDFRRIEPQPVPSPSPAWSSPAAGSEGARVLRDACALARQLTPRR